MDFFPSYGQGPQSTPDGFYDLKSLIDPRFWKESFLMALLFQMYLSTFASSLMLVTTLITGKKAALFSDNPMLRATSPSDFWGRRWNLLVHKCLKNGVFKPVYYGSGSQLLAVLAAFLASGLFHEWLLPNVFFNYPNSHGPTLLFFMWQAALVILEVLSRPLLANVWLPPALQTAIVVFAGLPPAHWFCDSFWRSQFFVQGQMGLPIILPVDS